MTDNERTTARTSEILFVKASKNGIPNKDPETNNARRIFNDGRISLSDVSIKRDARDYVAARYPEGEGGRSVYFRAERNEEGLLLGRQEMARLILEHHNVDPDGANLSLELPRLAWDVRTFGVVYSVGGENFNQVGPAQISWAHSLHPVESQFVRNTVSLPARGTTEEKRARGSRRPGGAGGAAVLEEDVQRGAKQGTVAESWIVPFAVYAAPAVVSGALCKKIGTAPEDVDLLLEGLWKGTRLRQSRGRGLQQPLFMLHVEYEDPFFRIGNLEEGVRLDPGPESDAWRSESAPSSVSEVSLECGELRGILERNSDKIARARLWRDERFRLTGGIEEAVEAQPLF